MPLFKQQINDEPDDAQKMPIVGCKSDEVDVS
jgi:hypothetical protein